MIKFYWSKLTNMIIDDEFVKSHIKKGKYREVHISLFVWEK